MKTAPQLPGAVDSRLIVPVWRLREGAALFHEGTAAESLYVVRSGSLKCEKASEDGYHQVLSFVGPGEVVGFEALYRGQQLTSAVALEVSTVFTLPVHGLDSLRERSPLFDHSLQLALSRQLARAGDMAELLAAVASDVRLARFLVWLSNRMAESGQSPLQLRLRMCRRDIASLLGVANETVSRSFTSLADAGCVRVMNRDVDILDLEALKERARCTRGWADSPASPHHHQAHHVAAADAGNSSRPHPAQRAAAAPTHALPARNTWFPSSAGDIVVSP